ncbi:hypothetical protein HPB51_007810 [Rhipicephalus microplus]|uniref:Uncharacterized protein n=1 Tax=Rhipicephalus microplus TaxID=6941 RepID=A0A9J6EYU1_RHIMP|nr:hypothetical protein HPB51_007810 [Rhipicephalus microplus]
MQHETAFLWINCPIKCALAAVRHWSWCREDLLCAYGVEARGICDALARSQGAANASHSFSHYQDECNRSYARAAGRRPETQQSELLMDEEESEQACLPATPQKQTTLDDTPVLNKSKQVSSALDTNARRKMGNPAAPTMSEQTCPAPAMHAASQLQATCPETPASQANATSTPLNSSSQHSLVDEAHENEDLPGDLDTPRIKLESASAKRRRDSDDGAQVDETQVKSEVQCKVVSGGKKRNAARQRSSSLKRDDGRSN